MLGQDRASSFFGKDTQVIVADQEGAKPKEKMSSKLVQAVSQALIDTLPKSDETKMRIISFTVRYLNEGRTDIKNKPTYTETYVPFRNAFLSKLRGSVQGQQVIEQDVLDCVYTLEGSETVNQYAPLAEAALYSIFLSDRLTENQELLIT